jgi:hypothetical protein
VKRILHEPAYKGDTILWRRQRDARTQRVMPRPDEEWITLPSGVTPALVPPEMWEKAQQRLRANRSVSRADVNARNQRQPYLLRGLIFCYECGRAMAPDSEHGVHVCRCTSRAKAGGSCGRKRVPADDEVAARDFPRDPAGRLLPIDSETRVQVLYRYPSEAGLPSHRGPATSVCLDGWAVTWPADKVLETERCFESLYAKLRQYVQLPPEPGNPVAQWLGGLRGDAALRVNALVAALEELDPQRDAELLQAVKGDLTSMLRWARSPGGTGIAPPPATFASQVAADGESHKQ